MIATREFEVPMDFGDLNVTADIDISDDIIRVVNIALEDKLVLADIKLFPCDTVGYPKHLER